MSHVTVFLVRHGAHDLLDRCLAGRTPGVSLNAAGRAQAERVAARLARENLGALYTSPMERARETAAPIAAATGLKATIDEGLNELEHGEWTGRAFDVLREDERWHGWNRERSASRMPGGECMAEVGARAAASIERWRRTHPDGRVAATSHADVIKAVVCGLLGLSFDRVHDFEVSAGSLTALVAWQGGGKLLLLNEVPA